MTGVQTCALPIYSFSSNEDEKKLIELHYQNSIVKTGVTRQAITEDLKKAKLLANAPKIQRENEELAEAMKAKQTISNSSYGNSGGRAPKKEDYSKAFSPGEWAFIQKRGWTDDMIKKAAESKKTR